MTGLSLPERAERLGVTCRELVRLAEGDSRLFTWPALDSEGSVARLRRWVEAGQPSADLNRLEFTGADEVRSLVAATLAKLPRPVAWHAAEFVVWLEIGRRHVAGWMSVAPPMRTPKGDMPHVIVLNGAVDDEKLPGVIAHETGHSWHRDICEGAPQSVSMSRHERTARLLVVARDFGDDAGKLARERVGHEMLADRTAEVWGFRNHGPSELDLLRSFHGESADAADLAAKIEADLDAAEGETS